MTSPAIGASAVIGIAFEQLPAPVLTSVTPGTGGTIAAGTYKYMITAINALGETTVSNEVTATIAASGTAVLVWPTVTGATGYNIYRTAVGGGAGTELKLATVGAVLTYTDTGAATPLGALPTINSAGTPGTYAAPTKFFPFLDESFHYIQDTQWRRPIRNTASIVGPVAGNSHIEGDINIEFLTDVVPYFLYCTRCSITKTGAGPFTYVFTPTSAAIPAKTMSVTTVRNGQVFGYVGCVVSSFTVTIDGMTLKFTASMLGRDEASQSVPVPTWPVSTPFGAGQYSLQIPTATQVLDADSFNFAVDDSGVADYRIRSGSTGPAFINYGESTCTLTVDRDFITRADYDTFKALTAQTISLVATKGSEVVTINMPTAVKDTYETSIGGEGDLIRASIAYQGVIDASGKHYQITVVTPTENII